MKLLFLSQGTKISDHPGWDASFQKLEEEGILTGYVNIPYRAWEGKWNELWDRVIDISKNEPMDIVYFHYYHHRRNPDPYPCIQGLRKLKQKPTIITSAGDPFSKDWKMPFYPATFKKCAVQCDLVFSTQMGEAAKKMASWGAKNIILTPNSICPVRFAKKWTTDCNAHSFDFDIVMVGSRNSPRLNPFNNHYWAFRKRTAIVDALCKRYGNKFGLFGIGWKGYSNWQGPVLFNEQQLVFRRGRLAVDGYPYSTADYYSSNRPHFIIASAIPTLTYRVPRLDKIFKEGEHCYFFDDIPGLLSLIDRLLDSDPDELYQRANTAARHNETTNTQYHRARFIIDAVSHYRDEEKNNQPPDLPYFHDEVNQEDEKHYAAINWRP